VYLSLFCSNKPALVGEIRDEQPSKDTEQDRENALDNEDPCPAKTTAFATEVRNTKRSQGAKSTQENGSKVENGQSLLNFVAFVPCRNDEDKRWEEASLVRG